MEEQHTAGRSEFAAEAEALGVTTNQILSRRFSDEDQALHVIFCPEEIEPGEKPIVWAAALKPDGYGILREYARAVAPRYLQEVVQVVEDQVVLDG